MKLHLLNKFKQFFNIFNKNKKRQNCRLLFPFVNNIIIENQYTRYPVYENDIDNLFDDITSNKELAWGYIDDRCINFDGNFDNLTNSIKSFKPWYKK